MTDTREACANGFEQFAEYIATNYRGEVVFHDPRWHAERIWRAARHALSPASVAAPSNYKDAIDLTGLFEAAWIGLNPTLRTEHWLHREDDGSYAMTTVRGQWMIWNAARAQRLTSVTPEGWQLVPKEPTREMLNAAIDIDSIRLGCIASLGFRCSPQRLFERCYAAMLTTAPPAPVTVATPDERVAFEVSVHHGLRGYEAQYRFQRDGDVYADPFVQAEWRGWQAARAVGKVKK